MMNNQGSISQTITDASGILFAGTVEIDFTELGIAFRPKAGCDNEKFEGEYQIHVHDRLCGDAKWVEAKTKPGAHFLYGKMISPNQITYYLRAFPRFDKKDKLEGFDIKVTGDNLSSAITKAAAQMKAKQIVENGAWAGA